MVVAMLLLLPLDPGWGAGGLIARLGLIGIASGVVAACDQSLVMGMAPAETPGASAAVSGLLRSLFYSFGAAVASAAAWLVPAPTIGIRVVIGASVLFCLYALAGLLGVRNRLREVDAEAAPAAVAAA